MNKFNLVCDLCNKEIPNGAAYVSINYNIESMDMNPVNYRPTVQVISSDQLLTLCGKCGNNKNAMVVKEVLKITLQSKEPKLN